MPNPLQVVILAAGIGRRFRGATSKVLCPLWGRSSVGWVVEAALGLAPSRVVVVAGSPRAELEADLASLGDGRLVFATQHEPLGTGHAVLAAREALVPSSGAVLVLNGDCPLVTTSLLAELLEVHGAAQAFASVVTAKLADAASYGRIVRDERGELQAIVEARDADPETLAIREINAGVWALDRAAVDSLPELGRDNAQREVYLTDLAGLGRRRGRRLASLCARDAEEALGFNDHLELAQARTILKARILRGHLARGVEIVDPATTFIDAAVRIEPGARILPCTVIEGDTRIAAGCEVGPFAHLRAGTRLAAGAEVGNFTETKQASLGEGSKAKHLSYLGDVTVGARANIGAGTITANYDGRAKHATVVGERAFIGSGTVLVAPVTVEAGATTGAGAVVTRRSVVREGETWVGVPAKPLGARKQP